MVLCVGFHAQWEYDISDIGSMIWDSACMALYALDGFYARTVLQRRATEADIHAHHRVETWRRTCSAQTLTVALRLWRLQQDGIWELQGAEHIASRQGNNDAKKSELLKYKVSGGFPAPIYTILRDHPRLLVEIAADLLERNFPASIHEDILDAVGLNLHIETIIRATRDPQFRVRVLTVYGCTCAICGFDVRLGETALGVEAAHIKWHQAGGPNIETNRLALCILHHKLFDRGALTIALNRQVQVSEYAYGATGFTEWLLAYHGKPIRPLC
jgi:putative restriction endonuclease